MSDNANGQVTLTIDGREVTVPRGTTVLRAAERLGTEPGQCLFVGDGGSHEHEGARRAGMRTALYLELLKETSPSLAARRPRNTDWVLCSFTDLVDLAEHLARTP